MAKQISDLPTVANVNNPDLIILRQGSSDFKAEISQVKSGLLTANNNLSDVQDAATARTNLGVDTSQFASLDASNDFGFFVNENLQIKSYSETNEDLGSSGVTQDFDLEVANSFIVEITANCTLTFSNPRPSGETSSFSILIENGGSFAVTFPVSVVWRLGTAPILTATGFDLLAFITYDAGTTWYGIIAGNDFS